MPEGAAITSIWTVLLPVLIGGTLPILGAAIGPFVTQWLSERSVNQTKRLQRFEELLGIIHEHDHWTDTQRKIAVFGEKLEIAAPPLSKATGIAAVYFPDLLLPLKKLDAASASYRVWMFTAAQKRLGGDFATINEGFNEAYQPYLNAFTDAVAAATDYAISQKGLV